MGTIISLIVTVFIIMIAASFFMAILGGFYEVWKQIVAETKLFLKTIKLSVKVLK